MSERRMTSGVIEARQADAGMTIIGHASMWDTPYDLYGFTERVARGAFKKSLKESDIAALWNHDPNIVLGRRRSGTLRLEEDDRGLRYEVDLPDTAAARDLYKLIDRGDVYQSSFSFEVVKDEWEEREDALPLRTLKEVRLYDVSPVTFPASGTTDVDVQRAMRSMALALRGALPVHHTATATGEWDGPGAKANLKNDGEAGYYRQAFAWVDADGDPDVKASYKFIHHNVGADGSVGAANLTAVSAAIAVLNGGRGGTTIPADDKPGVYRHLAAHLKDADKEPPELKSLAEPEDEPEVPLVTTPPEPRDDWELYL